jgi:hypothetical protein
MTIRFMEVSLHKITYQNVAEVIIEAFIRIMLFEIFFVMLYRNIEQRT